jgi:putative NIF3 family GTP cyclohydrolase 1 type 2
MLVSAHREDKSMTPLTRREFVAASSALLSGSALVSGSPMPSGIALGQAPAPSPATPLTAGEVIDRIRKNVGVPWFPKTVDNLLTGAPETPIQGIATTMMATLDVVERAVAQGCNMIVSHETPLYIHQDRIDDTQSPGGINLTDDPTLVYKLDYCKRNNVCIFHFHDHWHFRKPVDGIAQGMVNQLGWQKNVNDPADPKKLTFDSIPLAKFTQQIAARLNSQTIRVIGDPTLPVLRVVTSWGYISREPGIRTFASPDVDVFIGGETREWELVEYCQDSIKAGNKKALILVGHVMSEQGGMILCADWLRPFIPEVPIKFVAATEPFWLPSNPPKS